MAPDSEPLATAPVRPPSEPPPSLVPPADSLRPPRPTIPEFPPAPTGLFPESSAVAIAAARIDPPSSLRFPAARSLPPMPDVEPILELAAKARDGGDWDAALDHYKRALFVVPPHEKGVQASLYASVAEVKLAQGKPREAETNFEKALVINPKHLRSIVGLIGLAEAEGDWARLVVQRRRRVAALNDADDADEKATELCVIADVELKRLRRVEAAIETLEAAAKLRAGDVEIVGKLREAYVEARAWPRVIETLDELVRLGDDPQRRGSYRFAQADVLLGRLREEPRGIAFLEMALDEDPACDRALAALVALRTRREEWAELAAVYERLIDRHAGRGDRDRAWEVCRKLGILRRDRLHDGPGALEALRGAVEVRPDDAESRASLAELYAAKGERATAVRELETVTRHAPLRAQTYRRLFDFHQRAARPDRAWLVATCLEELGAADVAHDLVIDQLRTDGPIRPTASLESEAWRVLLAADGADPLVEEILLTIGETAVALRLEDLAARRKLSSLDPATKQDRASTASAVRTFVWAARALEVPLPDLYVFAEVPSGIAAVPAPAPSTALGPQALAGRSVQQLAFLAGRHLTYYRPAHYPLVFFPTLAELSSLVLSAVRLVIHGLSVPPPPDGEPRIADRLAERLSPEQKTRLDEIVGRLDARGGRLDLFAWIRGVELTAARVGLLLAGDLRVAMRLIGEETRTIGELSLQAKRADLIAFTASEAYALVRERMGVAFA